MDELNDGSRYFSGFLSRQCLASCLSWSDCFSKLKQQSCQLPKIGRSTLIRMGADAVRGLRKHHIMLPLTPLPLVLVPCSRRQQIHLILPMTKKKMMSLLQQRWVQRQLSLQSGCSQSLQSYLRTLRFVSEHKSQRLGVGLHLSGTATLKRETFESNSLFQPSRRVAPTVGLSSNLWSSRPTVGALTSWHG